MFSLGEYGATYHYTITAVNTGTEERRVTFQIANTDGLVIGVKESGESAYRVYNTELLNTALKSVYGISQLSYDTWFPESDMLNNIRNAGYDISFPDGLMTVVIPAGETKSFEVVTTLVPGANGGTYERIFVE